MAVEGLKKRGGGGQKEKQAMSKSLLLGPRRIQLNIHVPASMIKPPYVNIQGPISRRVLSLVLGLSLRLWS